MREAALRRRGRTQRQDDRERGDPGSDKPHGLLPVACKPSASPNAARQQRRRLCERRAKAALAGNGLKWLELLADAGAALDRRARVNPCRFGKFCRAVNDALTMPARVSGEDRSCESREPAHAATPAASSGARRTASGTFSLDTDNTARPAGAATGMRIIGGIDTLLALQGVEEPAERRSKAVKRGRTALDALDALKLGLLSGTLDTAALARLKAVATGLAEPTGDPALDTVLAEIELRVEVELAKIGMPQAGAQRTV